MYCHCTIPSKVKSLTKTGPPNPENVPEDGKLKSEVMVKDNRRYYLDLKENQRGRFLRVSVPYCVVVGCVGGGHGGVLSHIWKLFKTPWGKKTLKILEFWQNWAKFLKSLAICYCLTFASLSARFAKQVWLKRNYIWIFDKEFCIKIRLLEGVMERTLGTLKLKWHFKPQSAKTLCR